MELVGKAPALAALLALGCATAPVTITYTPGQPGPLGGANPQLRSVTVTPQAYGRQCFDFRVEPDGTVGVTFAVDASSDWAGLRVLPTLLPEVVAAVMAVVGTPMEVIGQLLGVPRREMQQPSPTSACSAIFEE